MNEADNNERHMSRVEAVAILMALAKERSMGVEQVTALQMGASLMLNKHMQRQRIWARRRARVEGETAHDPAVGTGAFFTPPDVLDAVTANPPMEADADLEAPKEADDE